jgi:hypothetical protein
MVLDKEYLENKLKDLTTDLENIERNKERILGAILATQKDMEYLDNKEPTKEGTN